MKFIRDSLNSASAVIEKNKYLSKLKPIFNATDEALFGTDKVTTIPHLADGLDIKRLMSMVIIGLLPAAVASIYFWGLKVIAMIMVSYIFGGLVEVAFAIARKKEIHEGFLVTGLIFPLILPPTTPLWVVAVGVMFGVLFGKEVFGGTGRNIFNPAIVGRIFLSIAFPKMLSANWQQPFAGGWGGFIHYQPLVDATATATPLVLFKSQNIITNFSDLLFGLNAGSMGETFRLGIILGGLFLIAIKIVDWRIPLAYLATVVIFPLLANNVLHTHFAPPLLQLFSGGLLLGAFFMATDPVTCPFTKVGKWIGGALLGILTVLIRGLSGYVEGVMFSIILINAFTPLIDTIVLKIRYRNT